MRKTYFRDASSLKQLVPSRGSSFATDRITVDGRPVGYMYREVPDSPVDSGWRFFAGDESDAYVNDPQNVGVFEVNTIANYDPAVVPFLDAPFGTRWIRSGDGFVLDGATLQ